MTKEIEESLHPLEKKVLPFLDKYKDLVSLQEASKLKDVEIMRALQWLGNKNALKLKSQTKAIISLDKNGEKYIKEGLPEKRFLKSIENSNLQLKEMQKKANLDNDELTISIGQLKNKSLINLGKEVSITGFSFSGKNCSARSNPSFLPMKLPKILSSLKKTNRRSVIAS